MLHFWTKSACVLHMIEGKKVIFLVRKMVVVFLNPQVEALESQESKCKVDIEGKT